MNLSICGRHLDVTPAIREYVMNKLARCGISITSSIPRSCSQLSPCGTKPKSPCV